MKYRNTQKVWDSFWKSQKFSNQKLLEEEAQTIRWQRIKHQISVYFKPFKNIKTIEIGSGMGQYSALHAQLGAQTTLLDNSDKALELAKQFFKDNGLKTTLINADALNPPKKLLGQYDIALSIGLIEHFKGEDRLKIIKSHLDLVHKNGLVIIAVPNKYNLPYRIYKLGMELIGRWPFGLEIPFSRAELKKDLKQLGAQEVYFTADSLFWSLNFINPLLLINRKYKINSNRGTFLDPYLSFSLVVIAIK